MAYGFGVDKDVQKKVDTFRGNPEALQQRYAQNQELIDLLALQKIKSEKESAAREIQLKMAQQQAANGQEPSTIKAQREQQVMGLTQQEISKQQTGLMDQQAKAQQQGLQSLAQQAGRSNMAAPPMPQRPPSSQPPRMSGVAANPTPGMARMAGGGIVAFAGPDGSLVSSSPAGRAADKFMSAREEERVKRALQGAVAKKYRSAAGVMGLFQNQSDEERAKAQDIIRRVQSMTVEELQSALEDPAVGPPAAKPEAVVPEAVVPEAVVPEAAVTETPPGPPTTMPLPGQNAPGGNPPGPPTAMPGPGQNAPGGNPPGPPTPIPRPNLGGVRSLGTPPGMFKMPGAPPGPPNASSPPVAPLPPAPGIAGVDPTKMGMDEETRVANKLKQTPEQRAMREANIKEIKDLYAEEGDERTRKNRELNQFLASGANRGSLGSTLSAASQGAERERQRSFGTRLKGAESVQKQIEDVIGLDTAADVKGIEAGGAARREAGERASATERDATSRRGQDIEEQTRTADRKAKERGEQILSSDKALSLKVEERRNEAIEAANKLTAQGQTDTRLQSVLSTTNTSIAKIELEIREAFQDQIARARRALDGAKGKEDIKKAEEALDKAIEERKLANDAATADLKSQADDLRRRLTPSGTSPEDQALVDKYNKKK